MTKPRTPRANAAAIVEAPKSADMPATVDTASAAAAAPLFSLTGKAPRQANTPQLGGVKSGLGAQWVQAAKPVHNSRATAIATIAALGETFTQADALTALGALPKGTLGSGSPRSYWAAFVSSGYIKAC